MILAYGLYNILNFTTSKLLYSANCSFIFKKKKKKVPKKVVEVNEIESITQDKFDFKKWTNKQQQQKHTKQPKPNQQKK